MNKVFIEGQKVKIIDGSDADGEIGCIYNIGNDGIISVELSCGTIWPVTNDEIEAVKCKKNSELENNECEE